MGTLTLSFEATNKILILGEFTMIQKLFHHKYARFSLVSFALLSLVFLINVGVPYNNSYQITDPDPTFYYMALNSFRQGGVSYAFEYFDTLCWFGAFACLFTGIIFLTNSRYMKLFLVSYTTLYQTLLFFLFGKLYYLFIPQKGGFGWQAYLLLFMSISCSIIVWYGYKKLANHSIENIKEKHLFSKTKLITGLLSIGTLIFAMQIAGTNPLHYLTEFIEPYFLLLYSVTLVIMLIFIHQSHLFSIWFKGTLINLYLLFLPVHLLFFMPEKLLNIQNGVLFTLSLFTLVLAWQFSDKSLFRKANKQLIRT